MKKPTKKNVPFEMFENEGKTYKLIELSADGNVVSMGVMLLKKPYDGVIYKYNSVTPPKPGDKTLTFAFEYDILENTDKLELEDDSTFHTLIGDICVEVITSELARKELIDLEKVEENNV